MRWTAGVSARRRWNDSSALPECLQLASELSARCGTKPVIERLFVIGQQGGSALVCRTPVRCDGRANRATVIRIRCTSNEAISLEPIDDLRHIRLPAAVALGELGQAEGLGGEH